MATDRDFESRMPDGTTVMNPRMAPPRHMAVVQISDAFLLSILQNGTRAAEVAKNAMPADARIVDVHYDGRTISLKVEGSGLPLVREGQMIPAVDVWFREVGRETTP